MNICVFGSAGAAKEPFYAASCFELGYEIASHGHTLVYGGGNTGMMGEIARGAYKANGTILGIAPDYFHHDDILFPHCTELILTHSIRRRLQAFEQVSDWFLAAPGGIGTYQEFFEVLTLRSLGELSAPVGILNLNGYYDPLLHLLQKAAVEGFLKPEIIKMITVCEDAKSLLNLLGESCPAAGKKQME